MLKLNPNITAIEEETAFTVLDRANALKAKGAPVINLGIGQPDFTPPRHILEAAEKAVRDGPHGYSSPAGLAGACAMRWRPTPPSVSMCRSRAMRW